jgi:hypothetical protein
MSLVYIFFGGGLLFSLAALWFVLWKKEKDFEFVFILLYVIGLFQGIIDKVVAISSVLPTSTIWGPLKYSLLLLMIGGTSLRLIRKKRFIINTGMKIWIGVFVLTWGMFAALMIEARSAEPRFLPTNTLQNYGIVNMLMCVIVYLNVKQTHINTFLKILTWSGIVAALVGVVQIILGPVRLVSMGINVLDANSFASLAADDVGEGFVNLLRTFSFFASHHGFSAFLIIAIMGLQVLRFSRNVTKRSSVIGMTIMWIGMATTFNLTNILFCTMTLMLFVYLHYTNATLALQRIFLRKTFWKTILLILVILPIVLATVEPVRKRVFGAFDFREGAQSAGGSLYLRHIYISNGIQALMNHPLGLGLNLSVINNSKYDMKGYSRGDYFSEQNLGFSADCWFLWLFVQLGVFGFLLYILCFLIPIIWGWSQREKIANAESMILFYGLLSLLVFTIIAGISNSPTLVYSPSNLLIWAAAGLLMKVPSWQTNNSQTIKTSG